MDKVYCDECIHLQNRDVFAEVIEGNYEDRISTKTIKTKKRYYCPIKEKWFSIGATIQEIGFSYCEKGEKT